jgi:hypothetical protein
MTHPKLAAAARLSALDFVHSGRRIQAQLVSEECALSIYVGFMGGIAHCQMVPLGGKIVSGKVQSGITHHVEPDSRHPGGRVSEKDACVRPR